MRLFWAVLGSLTHDLLEVDNYADAHARGLFSHCEAEAPRSTAAFYPLSQGKNPIKSF